MSEYRLELVHYALPVQGSVGFEKQGNFAAATSVVRSVFYALNQKASNYEVFVEGVGAKVDAIDFTVKGVLAENPTGEYRYSTRVNFGERIDLPSFFYTVDELLEDKVAREMESKGNRLVSDNLHIGSTEQFGLWKFRIFSGTVAYEVELNGNPGYMDRTLTLRMKITDEADRDDLRAALEIARVLADEEFRQSEYNAYRTAHRNKPFAQFQVFNIDQEIEGELERYLADKMHRAIGDEFMATETFPEILTPENFAQFLPRYLVVAERMRHQIREIQMELSHSLAVHQKYKILLGEQKPNLDAILEVRAPGQPGIVDKIRAEMSTMDTEQYHLLAAPNSTQQTIMEQLVIGRGMMEKKISILESYEGMIRRLEESGIVAATVFDQAEFFRKLAQANVSAMAASMVQLLDGTK